jgi:hypothetical protein
MEARHVTCESNEEIMDLNIGCLIKWQKRPFAEYKTQRFIKRRGVNAQSTGARTNRVLAWPRQHDQSPLSSYNTCKPYFCYRKSKKFWAALIKLINGTQAKNTSPLKFKLCTLLDSSFNAQQQYNNDLS